MRSLNVHLKHVAAGDYDTDPADLRNTLLLGANLQGAYLQGADLQGAIWGHHAKQQRKM